MTDNDQKESLLFRRTRLCLLILACACAGVGGGYMLKFVLAHGGGKDTAMAVAIIAVSAFGLVRTVKELLRKQ